MNVNSSSPALTTLPLDRRSSLRRRLLSASLAVLGLSAGSTSSLAASINYGNYGPVAPGVTFLNVTESSATDPVPLFGQPAPVIGGLDFDPITFGTSSSNGQIDLTDGQLNMTIKAQPGVALNSLSLFEAGDYTLFTTGATDASAIIGATLRITVTELDGVDVAPFNLPVVTGSVSFSLPFNSGIVQPWTLGLFADISANIPQGTSATEIEIVIDNALASLSESQSISGAIKKDFSLTVDTGTPPSGVPTPESGPTAWLLAGALGLLLTASRSSLTRRTS